MARKADPLRDLQRRYKAKTGQPIPEEILREGLEVVERAVRWAEKGIVGVVPKSGPAVAVAESGSLMEWDRASEF